MHVYVHRGRSRDRDANALTVLARAAPDDRLNFLRGIRRVALSDRDDGWHAHYDGDEDVITLQPMFWEQPTDVRQQILLHEAGHRGQHRAPDTYRAFLDAGHATLANFLGMANDAHLDDWTERGIKRDELASEAFAESYSRFCLGRAMPDDVRRFWKEQVRA